MRYRHPCAVGVRRFGCSGDHGGGWIPAGSPRMPHGGVVVPVENGIARLKALLFLSQQPQTSRKLAKLAGLADGTKARTLVRTLNRQYDAEGSAFRVEEVAGGFQLMTRSKFAPWLRRLHSTPVEVRLSAPAMETLAVVAYRQPVLRAEIEAIRGVQSGEVLRQLIERDLVRIVGRSDNLGRPFLYGTTRQFLQVFGLRHLDELPESDTLQDHESTSVDGSDAPACFPNTLKQPNQSPIVEEEDNVKTLTIDEPRHMIAETDATAVVEPRHDDLPGKQDVFGEYADEDEFDDEEEDDDDFDDDDDDEPWEEVEDDDLEDEDWDEDDDEDWEDDDGWEEEEEDEYAN